MPAGIRSKTLDNVFSGQVPKRIIVGLVGNNAFNGAFKRNPFNIQDFGTNYFSLYVDGEQIPSKPLQPNYEDGNEKSVLAYHTLFSGTGIHFSDTGHTMHRGEYSDGFCLMAFDLTPDLSASETSYWNLVRNGNVRIELGFAKELEQTVNCLVYAEFDNVIEIDRFRNVTTDYGNVGV